jgi:predicted deacylase
MTKPTILVVCGLHGDEPSSLLLAQALIDQNARTDARIDIIAFANENAFAHSKRQLNHQDWNRSFLPNNVHSSVQWVAERVARADFVIDVHNDATCNIPSSILVPRSNQDNQKILQACNCLSPLLFTPIDDAKLIGTLCLFAQSLGKVSFIVELPPPECIRSRTIHSICRGILQLAQKKSCIETTLSHTTKIVRNEKRLSMRTTGLFMPALKKVPTWVSPGTLLGTAISPGAKNMAEDIRADEDSWVFAVGRAKIHPAGTTIIRYMTS